MSKKPKNLYESTDRIITNSLKVVSYISGLCLVGIMLVAFFNVIGEKLFKTGVPMSTEMIQYLHIPVVFLAAAYVTMDTGHTKIDLLSSHFPIVLQKLFTTFGYLCGAGVCFFISYRGWIQMGKFILRHRKSSVSGIGFDLWPFALILSLGFALMAISFMWSIVRQYAKGSELSSSENVQIQEKDGDR